jgi:hypothetical protein
MRPSLFIRLDSTLREIWIHCYERLLCQHYERFSIWITPHTSCLFYRRYELTNLSTFLFSTFPIGHKHPPSIFTLHDFVVGPFLRRLCDLPFYTFGFVSSRDLDSLLWEITNQCYDRFIFNITIDSYSTLREIHIQHYERFIFNITRDSYSTLREITVSTLREITVSTLREITVSTLREITVSTLREITVSTLL